MSGLMVHAWGNGKGGTRYFITDDDSSARLTHCPCCGQTMTRAAAERVIATIVAGRFSFAAAVTVSELWQKLARP